MKTSCWLRGASWLAEFAAFVCAAMIFIGSVAAIWIGMTAVCVVASLILSRRASQYRRAEMGVEMMASVKDFLEKDSARKYAQRQAELKRQINGAVATAGQLLDTLPNHLNGATRGLVQAEVDWRERVFNPFWTSIEGCACSLAEFKQAIEGIAAAARQYRAAAAEYAGPVPPFPVTAISVESMNSYSTAYDIMVKFTRRALGDRDFASIFELWRGNAIMERGFANLQSAVQQMSMDISNQISSLHSSLDGISLSILGAVKHQTAVSQRQHAETLAAVQRHEALIASRLSAIQRSLVY
jgi:hypothetical protein